MRCLRRSWEAGMGGGGLLLGHRLWSHDMTEPVPCVSVPSLEPRLEGTPFLPSSALPRC